MKKILATSSRGYSEASGIDIPSYELFNSEKIITFKVKIIDLPGPTRNGVLYPRDEFVKAVNSAHVQQQLKTGAFYGEKDHPLNPDDFKRWTRIEMSNATHKWTKLWFEGNELWGECQPFAGNGGLMLHALKGGELPSFSIRVIGSPKPKGNYTELSDIVLLAIDWVRYPGNPESYIKSTDVIDVKDSPLYQGYEYNERIIPRAESFDNIGIKENETVYSLGEGYYTVINQLKDEEIDNINKIRNSSF